MGRGNKSSGKRSTRQAANDVPPNGMDDRAFAAMCVLSVERTNATAHARRED